MVEPWETPFLQFVHWCCRRPLLRQAWPKLDARVIGLTLEEIKNIPRVIGVASGAEKVLGVVGAARAGLIDTLIVDLACANSVIKSLQPTAVKSA